MTLTPSLVTAPRSTIRRRNVLGLESLILVVGFVSRLAPVIRSAGLRGSFGYDSSVYYAASAALLRGWMPYRDFTLVHPPGVALALTPFAYLGQLTSDHAGFISATLAWMLLGAVNAVLVVQVAKAMGIESRAALAGGLLYAVWPGAVNSEFHVKLEPLGNCFLLLGLWAVFTAVRRDSRIAALLGGLGLGAAVGVKIWWILPLLVVLGWHLPKARRGGLLALLTGAITALLLIDGPFFVVAARQMWSMIVLDQLGRVRTHPIRQRLVNMTGIDAFHPTMSTAAMAAVLLCAGLLLAAVSWRARRLPGGRLTLALLGTQVALLLVAPPWFGYYTDFLSPAVALSFAAALTRHETATRSHETAVRSRTIASTVLVTAAAFVGTTGVLAKNPASVGFPAQALSPAVARAHCVMSDSPMSLIELNVLSRDLGDGCPNWVDVMGSRYGVETQSPDTRIGRFQIASWLQDLQRYLLSGDALVLPRSHARELGNQRRSALARRRILGSSGGVIVVRGKQLSCRMAVVPRRMDWAHQPGTHVAVVSPHSIIAGRRAAEGRAPRPGQCRSWHRTPAAAGRSQAP